jgi:hypothetical protein
MADQAGAPGTSSGTNRTTSGQTPGQGYRLAATSLALKPLVADRPAEPAERPTEALTQITGPDAPLIRRMMSALVEHVHAFGGLDAFECPKPSAAIHEAGHCVIYACEGFTPTRAAIWPISRLGRTQWVGKTYGTPPWHVDDRTTAEADLRHARCLMAGVISESLFDPEYRLGSSLDEWAIASGILQSVAVKTGRTPEQLWGATLGEIASRLRLHDQQVFAISAELMRKHAIQGHRLKSLLAPIAASRAAVRSQ